MKILAKLLLASLAVAVAAYVLPGVSMDSALTVLVAAVVLGIVNALVKPVLIVLTFPVTVVTLGLFLFVINAFMVMLAARLVPGFQVDGFWWALLFSLVLSLINAFFDSVAGDDK
jgi:putative membrane protein